MHDTINNNIINIIVIQKEEKQKQKENRAKTDRGIGYRSFIGVESGDTIFSISTSVGRCIRW